MEIDSEFYKVFCEVAVNGSFSKAAEKLYISQPAVTQTIKKLEEQLGGKLFFRNNNGITLTEEGKHLYEYIKDSIEVINNASNKFKQYINLEEGIIKIRTGSNNAKRILYKPLIKFCQKYPNIKVEISKGEPDDSIRLLSTGKIDMVILNTPYQIKYSNLFIEDILENEYIFVMSNEYALNNNVNVTKISDLNNYSLIIPKEETTARNILKEYSNNELSSYKYEVVSEEVRKDFAMGNLGISYVMKQLVDEELKTGKLIEIKLPEKSVNSKIGLVTLKNEISSFATKKLVEYIKDENNSN